MGFGDKCCVGGCNNDRRYHVVICSNHFRDGKPSVSNPIPTPFLTPFEHSNSKSPKRRRQLEYQKETATPAVTKSVVHAGPSEVTPVDNSGIPASDELMKSGDDSSGLTLCTACAQITRDADVRLYTGMQNRDAFRTLFEYLLPKAKNMNYWKEDKQTEAEKPKRYSDMTMDESPNVRKPGPQRKLKLEQELLLIMLRLHLALSVGDLAFRFAISDTFVSSIFISWVKLMKCELSWLIKWPSKEQTKKVLPKCFEKYYSKVRCIIDCSEVFIETPSSLELQAICWSDYKHHCTFKFLIGITSNGLISFVSDCYGGRASDKFIVMDSRFMNHLEPFDQVMADRGFKIRDDLAMYQANLAIPPSTVGKFQMPSQDVLETSRLANVRIYVEQAIGRVKHFKILSHIMPMSCLPLCDDILITCCSLCNLLPPQCE